jgi:hypothetical protein
MIPSFVRLPQTAYDAEFLNPKEEKVSARFSVYLDQALNKNIYAGGKKGGFGFGNLDEYLAFDVQQVGDLEAFFEQREYGVLERKTLKQAFKGIRSQALELLRSQEDRFIQDFEIGQNEETRLKIIDKVIAAVNAL